jgi:hypothetical protein
VPPFPRADFIQDADLLGPREQGLDFAPFGLAKVPLEFRRSQRQDDLPGAALGERLADLRKADPRWVSLRSNPGFQALLTASPRAVAKFASAFKTCTVELAMVVSTVGYPAPG